MVFKCWFHCTGSPSWFLGNCLSPRFFRGGTSSSYRTTGTSSSWFGSTCSHHRATNASSPSCCCRSGKWCSVFTNYLIFTISLIGPITGIDGSIKMQIGLASKFNSCKEKEKKIAIQNNQYWT